MSCLEQILEAASYKTTAVWPFTPHLENYPRKVSQTCWRSKDEFISNVLLWISTYRHASVGWPTKTHRSLQTLGDLSITTDDSGRERGGGEREGESKEFVPWRLWWYCWAFFRYLSLNFHCSCLVNSSARCCLFVSSIESVYHTADLRNWTHDHQVTWYTLINVFIH